MTGLGLLLGGGYNAWYATQVSKWSHMAYRDRHLVDKKALLAPDEAEAVIDDIPDADVVDEDEIA